MIVSTHRNFGVVGSWRGEAGRCIELECVFIIEKVKQVIAWLAVLRTVSLFFFFYVESMSKLDLITKFLCENVSFSSFLCHVEMSEFSLQFRNCSDVIWTTSKGMKRKIICHYRKPLEWQCLPQCTIGFLFFWWCNYFYFMHIVFIYLFFWPICMSVWGCWIPGNWNNR